MKFQYETLGNSSYLVIDFESGEDIVNYQMQMLINNDIKNIVKANKQQKNNNIQIYYNITSRISLEQALQRNKISKKGLINIIEGAVVALADCEEYRLPSAGVLFDKRYVFVKPGSFEPSFVYVPTSNENVGVESLKKLILDLIVSSKVEVTNDNFMQVLLETLNNPAVGADEIEKLCIRYKSDEAANGKQPADESVKPIRSIRTETVQPGTSIPQAETADVPQTLPNSVQPPIISDASVKEKGKSDNAKEKKEKSESTNKNKFFLLQIAFVAVLVALFLSGILNDENGNMNYTYLAGVFIALAGIDFVVCREMFVNKKDATDNNKEIKNKVKTVPSISRKEVPIKNNVPVRENVPVAPVMPVQPVQPIQKPPEQPQYIPNQPVYTPPQTVNMEYQDADLENCDTDVLIADDGAYLEFFENGLVTKIRLDKESVVVGKLSSQCDFAINNSKVSKMHAEFISRDSMYFVKDYNSTNGTYINGSSERIQSNVEYPINNGDRITLANVDLTFRC